MKFNMATATILYFNTKLLEIGHVTRIVAFFVCGAATWFSACPTNLYEYCDRTRFRLLKV